MNIDQRARSAAQQLGLKFRGRLPGGSVGVFLVRDAANVEWVLKFLHNSVDMALAQTELTRCVGDRGYPLPFHQQPVMLDVGLVQLQQRLRGVVREQLTMNMAEAMLQLNERQSSIGPVAGFNPFGDVLRTSLTAGLDGYCEHEPLRRYSDESRSLLEWLLEVGAASDGLTVSNDDAVHYDFHHLNVLWHGDRISGTFDWTDNRLGDRFFDVVTLAIDAVGHADAGVVEHLRQVLVASVPVDLLRLYVAHMLLRLAHWNIVHVPERAPQRVPQCLQWRAWVEAL